jgi:hypothetical protein
MVLLNEQILNEHTIPSLNSLVYDILFRPVELEDVPMWDQFVQYEKVRINKGKTHKMTTRYTPKEDETGMDLPYLLKVIY